MGFFNHCDSTSLLGFHEAMMLLDYSSGCDDSLAQRRADASHYVPRYPSGGVPGILNSRTC